MKRKIKVLVVDDSLFLRRTLPRLLESDPEIEVVGTASNGVEALEKTKALRPNVVTLDVLMPVMDGLTALQHIMSEAPTSVLMVSSVTKEGAVDTLKALSLGAVDFVTKPSGPVSLDIDKVRDELVRKVKIAYTAKIKLAADVDVTRPGFRNIVEELSAVERAKAEGAKTESVAVHANTQPGVEHMTGTSYMPGHKESSKYVVAIAASTGGPAALQLILAKLPADLDATLLIVQHIAPGFIAPLAERLNSLSPLTVREAQNNELLMPGEALIAPYGLHLRVVRRGNAFRTYLGSEPADALHRPSANVLFSSLANCCTSEICAIVLTGMGEDGALGLRAIREQGGYTIAQDEATSVVYGMPRRAVELEGARISLPLSQISNEIERFIKDKRVPA